MQLSLHSRFTAVYVCRLLDPNLGDFNPPVDAPTVGKCLVNLPPNGSLCIGCVLARCQAKICTGCAQLLVITV